MYAVDCLPLLSMKQVPFIVSHSFILIFCFLDSFRIIGTSVFLVLLKYELTSHFAISFYREMLC